MKNVLVLLADWANGLFAVLIAAFVTGISPEWWHFVVGALMSHIPDIDAVPEILRRGKVVADSENPIDHREGLHYPVVLVTIGIVLALQFSYWGIIFLLNIVFHFINDFYGTGWGIKLLWPLSNNNYKFLGRRANRLKSILKTDGDWNKLPEEERRLQIIVHWSDKELPSYISKWGMSDWVDRYYFKLNWISSIEYFFFFIAIVLTLFVLLD